MIAACAPPGSELLRRILFLPPQASSIAADVDALHFAVITATTLGAIAVAAFTAWFMLRFRRTRDDQPTPRIESGPWTMVVKVGGPLTLFLAFWLVGFRQYVALRTPPEGTFDVYVTAKQWMWKFAYPNGPTSISTLTVPVGRPVRLVLTSRDVIHSFYVPAFRIKQDVLPGTFVTTWFQANRVGTYDVYCAEYCGTSHSGMLGQVVVLSEEDFAKWLERQAPEGAATIDDVAAGAASAPPGTMAAYGAEVARAKQCLACHTVDGQKHIGPTWRGLYLSTVPLANGESVLADEAYLTRSMMDPGAEVHAGFANVMPVYRGQIDAAEAAALVEYIKSLRDAGPAQVITLPQVAVDAGPAPEGGAP